MKTKTNHLLIGSFVLTGVTVAIVMGLMLGAGTWAQPSLRLETYLLETVQGLEAGSDVRFKGVKIGTVEEITLARALYDTEEPYVVVIIEMRPLSNDMTIEQLAGIVQEYRSQGLHAELASQGLTGLRYIEADLETDPSQRLDQTWTQWEPRYPYIPAKASTLSRLGDSLEEVMDDVRQMDVRRLVENASNTFEVLSREVEAARLPDLGDRLGSFLDRATGSLDRFDAQIDRAVKAFEATSAEVTKLTLILEEDLDPEIIGPLLADARSTIQEFSEAADEIRGQLRGRGREVSAILSRLNEISSHLAHLSSSLERFPSLFLMGTAPQPIEPGK